MKRFSSYPGCHEVRNTLADFSTSLDKGKMWCYNILRDNNGSISYILKLDPITPGSVLLNSNLVAPNRENIEPILTVKRTKWSKSIGYFGLSIGADPSMVGKKNVYFAHPGWVSLNT